MLKACSSALLTKMSSLLQDGGAFEEAFSGHSWDGFGHDKRTGRQHWIKHVKTHYSKQVNSIIYMYTHFMRCFPHTHIYINVYIQCANILNVAFYWYIYICSVPTSSTTHLRCEWVQWPVFAESPSCLVSFWMQYVMEIVSRLNDLFFGG